jgi:NifB/MoaA-like Fe-S oxidoreductase
MLRSFYEEAMGCLTALDGGPQEPRHVSVATGVAAAPMLRDIADAVAAKCKNLTSHVYKIKNRWFGESITVSGLLTGRDIAEQLAGCDLGERLLLPRNTLRAEGDLFLCGMSPTELEEALGVPITFVGEDGAAFVEALLFDQ